MSQLVIPTGQGGMCPGRDSNPYAFRPRFKFDLAAFEMIRRGSFRLRHASIDRVRTRLNGIELQPEVQPRSLAYNAGISASSESTGCSRGPVLPHKDNHQATQRGETDTEARCCPSSVLVAVGDESSCVGLGDRCVGIFWKM